MGLQGKSLFSCILLSVVQNSTAMTKWFFSKPSPAPVVADTSPAMPGWTYSAPFIGQVAGDTALHEGDHVVVSGLRSKEGKKLNGLCGVVVSEDPKTAGRWRIDFENGDRRSVKGLNLKQKYKYTMVETPQQYYEQPVPQQQSSSSCSSSSKSLSSRKRSGPFQWQEPVPVVDRSSGWGEPEPPSWIRPAAAKVQPKQHGQTQQRQMQQQQQQQTQQTKKQQAKKQQPKQIPWGQRKTQQQKPTYFKQ